MQKEKPKLIDAGGQFCPNPNCPASGLKGQGNITIHCPKRGRYHCKNCRKTFSYRALTPFLALEKMRRLFSRY